MEMAHYGKVVGHPASNSSPPFLVINVEDMMRMGFLLMIVTALAASLFSGCAGLPRYVELSRDFSVEPVFTNRVILPQYRYYYTGPEHEPTALLALNREWTLDGLYWTEIDLPETQLKKWLRQFNLARGGIDDGAHMRISYDGMRVPGPDEREIGAIYARYGQVFVRHGEPGHLTIIGPEPPPAAAWRD